MTFQFGAIHEVEFDNVGASTPVTYIAVLGTRDDMRVYAHKLMNSEDGVLNH